MGYRCTAGTDGIHFRVGPTDPIVWHEWKELKNETKAKITGLSRTQINQKASPKYRKGVLAEQPHGQSHCDIEVYHVCPGKSLRVAGSKHFDTALNKRFPLAQANFGPLKLYIPRSAFIITNEYGKDVMKRRVAKVITGGASQWVDILDGVRRISWPVAALSL